MKIPRGFIKALTVIIVVGGLGYLTYIRVLPYFQEQQQEEFDKGDKEKKAKQQARPVEAQLAFRGDLIMRITAHGEIQPLQEIPIYARLAGELTDVNVYEGKKVRKNSLLAAFDTTEIALEYKQKENQLKKAKIEYIFQASTASGDLLTNSNGDSSEDRIQTFVDQANKQWENAEQLLRNNTITQDEFNQRRRNFDTAKAISGEAREATAEIYSGLVEAQLAFEKAKIAYDNSKLFAPISGVVANLVVQKGQRIQSGAELCKIIDVSKVRIEAGVLESEIADITIGRKATITLSAYPDQVFEGTVETISPVVTDKTNKITILIDNPERKLKPGMFAFVRIDAKIYTDRLLVPKAAVQTRDQKDLVLVVRNGRTSWSYIDRGLQNSEFVEVLHAQEGLDPGEPVCTSGHFTLGHDVPVRILNKLDSETVKK